MNQIIANLPKGILAALALGLGFAFILAFNPPATICDGQMEIFKASQKRFLFTSTLKGVEKRARIKDLDEACRFHAGPGGCAELFDGLRKLASDLSDLGSRCESGAGDAPEIREALWKSIELLARLAWGDNGPKNYSQRFGWLESAELELYCRLKAKASIFYGQETLRAFRERTLQALPGADHLSREQALERSLFSLPCASLR